MKNPDDIVVRRTYKSNLLDEIKFYEVDCDWKGLLTEARIYPPDQLKDDMVIGRVTLNLQIIM